VSGDRVLTRSWWRSNGDRQREGSSRCAMCQHESSCPPATSPDRTAARVVAAHQEQGGACCATVSCCSTTPVSSCRTAGSSPHIDRPTRAAPPGPPGRAARGLLAQCGGEQVCVRSGSPNRKRAPRPGRRLISGWTYEPLPGECCRIRQPMAQHNGDGGCDRRTAALRAIPRPAAATRREG
jgi:Family of unknown function (DUF5999)